MSLEDRRGHSRSRVLVNARQVAMYRCRELTDFSLPRIGQASGGRDHAAFFCRIAIRVSRSLHDPPLRVRGDVGFFQPHDPAGKGSGNSRNAPLVSSSRCPANPAGTT